MPFGLLSATYSVFMSGEINDAVGLLHVGDELGHGAVGVDAVDALGVDLALLVADVARVAEVDAALRVEVRSLGLLKRLPSQRSARVRTVPSFSVMLMRRLPPVLAPSQATSRPCGVEVEPVGPAAGVAVLGRFAGGGVETS